jgi:uncharacterized repeat protein (TIGR03803 family)
LAQHSPTLTTLYSFQSGENDAYQPNSALLLGSIGALYGTSTEGGTGNAGTAYQLTPPALGGDTWSESVLYSFGGAAEGSDPMGPLVIARSGALYGTASGGARTCGSANGNFCGYVFVLEPPGTTGGSLTKRAVYGFGPLGANGWDPSSGLTPGTAGVLYGTARYGVGSPEMPCQDGCGTVYSLTPPASGGGPWTPAVLHNFDGSHGSHPASRLVVGAGGVLYGTAGGGDPKCLTGCGIVYSLTPPSEQGGDWTFAVIHEFTAGHKGLGVIPGGVALGTNGILYGTTSAGGAHGYGTVFSLIPPSAPGDKWTERVLYSFGNGSDGASPQGTLAVGNGGGLFGTTSEGGDFTCTQAPSTGCGTVFELSPSAKNGVTWTFATLHAFTGGADGGLAAPGLAINGKGVLYGATSSGGASGQGTVYSLIP